MMEALGITPAFLWAYLIGIAAVAICILVYIAIRYFQKDPLEWNKRTAANSIICLVGSFFTIGILVCAVITFACMSVVNYFYDD